MNLRRSLSLALLTAFVLTAPLARAATTPGTLMYEGRMLDASRNPITSSITLRFSLWKSGDWTSGDATAGAINTSATNYGGWYETQTITPASSGIFQAPLGSSTALPTIDYARHKFLQVEVKSTGQPDTSYVILDPTGDNGADTLDRKLISSVPYAQNAETVGNRAVGTGSGDILALGRNGTVNTAQMGSGTNANNFHINADNSAGDATLTFGNTLQQQTMKYSATNSRFEFSDDFMVLGNITSQGVLSGASLTVSTLKSCDSIDTDASGNLVCGSDAGSGMSRSEADQRFVNQSGDTMTGTLTIANGKGLTASGTLQTEGNIIINKDDTAQDAVLTFGNNLGSQTLKYSSTNHRFEFSDDLSINGDLTITGRFNGATSSELMPLKVSSGAGLTINIASGSYRIGNTLTHYNGGTGIAVSASATLYVFFGSGGLTVRAMSFPTDESFIPLAVVTTSSSGVTDVSDQRTMQTDTREHDVVEILSPEYDKATYEGDATNNVGALSLEHDTINKKNYYSWTSTRGSLQDYDIYIKASIPQDFVAWKSGGATNALTVHYRSTSANASDNALDISVFDTNGSAVTLTGTSTGLASTSWTSTSLNFSGTPTWTVGQEYLIKIHVSAKDNFQIHAGSIELRQTLLTGK